MAERTPLEVGIEVSGGVIAAGAYLYVAGGAVLWARYAAVDLPATTAVSNVPQTLQFATGATSLAVPLAILALIIVGGLLLGLLDYKYAVLVILAAIVLTSVVAEWLTSRDGITSSTQTATVLAVAAAVSVAAILSTLVAKDDTLAWILSCAMVVAAAAAVWDRSAVVTALGVVIVGLALLGTAPVVAHLSTDRATAWVAVPIAASALLFIRLLFEFQPPAPLAPVTVYSSATRPCDVPEERDGHALCRTAGYLIAQGDNLTLVAAVEGSRAVSVRRARCKRRLNGMVVSLPTDQVVETQILGREQVWNQDQTISLTLLDQVLERERLRRTRVLRTPSSPARGAWIDSPGAPSPFTGV